MRLEALQERDYQSRGLSFSLEDRAMQGRR